MRVRCFDRDPNRNGGRVKAAGSKLQHGLNLLACHVVLFYEFVDTRAHFETFDESRLLTFYILRE